VPTGCPAPRHVVRKNVPGWKNTSNPRSPANETVSWEVGGVVLRMNIRTSVVGLALVELQNASGATIAGYSLLQSDSIKGNYINKTVSWGTTLGHTDHMTNQHTNSLSRLAGQWVAVKVVMTDADLFSFSLGCM
jgi:hypothetical protein